MKQIPLTRGFFALVDDSDFEKLSSLKWCVQIRRSGIVYAGRGVVRNGKNVFDYMHRVIMGATAGKEVDHINHDGLDNRRCNLRLCTHGQNMLSRKPYTTNTSGFTGVTRSGRKWQAQLWHKGTKYYLGTHESPLDASKAYEAKAQELYQEFYCKRIKG